jgi:uroporphyrinogen-III synthase
MEQSKQRLKKFFRWINPETWAKWPPLKSWIWAEKKLPKDSNMPENDKKILCTAPVDPYWTLDTPPKGVTVTVLPFIETRPLHDPLVDLRIEAFSREKKSVAFTSANAVSYVLARIANRVPDWNVYCLEGKTARMVTDFFGPSQPLATAPDGESLAKRILSDRVRELVFFCGNHRRDLLPSMLAQQQVAVHELVVYETKLTPKLVGKKFDAILFFSPSAVKSFFLMNKIDKETILFAIGQTTAEAIRQMSMNKLIVGDSPQKDLLLQRAVDYLNTGCRKHNGSDKLHSDEPTQE